MDNTEITSIIDMAPEIPITPEEYAKQNDVSCATVERWFKYGKKIRTVELDLSDLS